MADQDIEYQRNYRQTHKKEKRIWEQEDRKNNIQRRLSDNLRNRTNRVIKTGQKAGSAVKDLGCSVDFLKQWLELQFKSGMTWQNWGFGDYKWNIDHIIPLSKFDLTDREQFLKAHNYTNLQPLWQPENFAKGSKIYA